VQLILRLVWAKGLQLLYKPFPHWREEGLHSCSSAAILFKHRQAFRIQDTGRTANAKDTIGLVFVKSSPSCSLAQQQQTKLPQAAQCYTFPMPIHSVILLKKNAEFSFFS